MFQDGQSRILKFGETDLVITEYGKEQTKNEQKIKQLKHKTQIVFPKAILKNSLVFNNL